MLILQDKKIHADKSQMCSISFAAHTSRKRMSGEDRGGAQAFGSHLSPSDEHLVAFLQQRAPTARSQALETDVQTCMPNITTIRSLTMHQTLMLYV